MVFSTLFYTGLVCQTERFCVKISLFVATSNFKLFNGTRQNTDPSREKDSWSTTHPQVIGYIGL